MPTPIPSNISPFVQPSKPGSLTLLTSALDATSNWLLLRYLYAALRLEQQDGLSTKRTRGASSTEKETTDNKTEALNVILVSFLRPFELWKEMAKKIGLDFPSLLSSSSTGTPPRLIYIDAFTHLSFPPTSPTPRLPQPSHSKVHTLHPLTTLSALETQLLSLVPSSTTTTSKNGSSSSGTTHLLAIDALDLLLASSPPNTGVTPQTLTSLLLTLRARPSIHSTILTLSADSPLLLLHNNLDTTTPLSLSHRQFLTSIAHQSDRVIQLRGLETGAARDVGGVLRVSRGGAAAAELREMEGESSSGSRDGNGREGDEADADAEGEWLYHVKGDGGVRVWARGE